MKKSQLKKVIKEVLHKNNNENYITLIIKETDKARESLRSIIFEDFVSPETDELTRESYRILNDLHSLHEKAIKIHKELK